MKKRNNNNNIAYLLKCPCVDDLFYLFELMNGVDYRIIKNGDYQIYVLLLKHDRAKQMYECIKDIDIYFPKIQLYLSDYIILKNKNIKLSKSILKLISVFSVDDIFTHAISNQKIIKARIKINQEGTNNSYSTTNAK